MIEQPKFRGDIEGLRALAVTAVILFHLLPDHILGGFLGVDIFFVVSGYVISASLFSNREQGLYDFLVGFYARRLRRLLPALLAVIFFSTLIYTLTNQNPNTVLKSAIFATFGLSNIFFLHSSEDYFSDHIDENPLLHTWSLGVEEQFYLLYPVLLFLLHRRPVALLTAIIGVSLISMIGFVYFYDQNKMVAFFASPLRFWEMLIGAAIFFTQRRWSVSRQAQPGPILLKTMQIAGMGALMALLAVLPYAPNAWPSYIFVVFATSLILISAPGSLSARVLSVPLFQYIGKISYSLYLWHWPVIAFTYSYIGADIVGIVTVLVATGALAIASFHLLENPIRTRQRLATWPRFATTSLAAVAVVVSFALATARGPLEGRMFIGDQPKLVERGVGSLLSPYEVPGEPLVWNPEKCALKSNDEVGKRITLSDCIVNPSANTDKKILVVGNSFSMAFRDLFHNTIQDGAWKVAITSSWGASPVETLPNDGPWRDINDYYWSTVIPQAIRELNAGDYVFLVSDLAGFTPQDAPQLEKIELLRDGLQEMSHELQPRGIELALVYGVGFVRDANCTPDRTIPQWYMPRGADCQLYTKLETLERRKPLAEMLTQLEEDEAVTIIDLIDLFCDDRMCSYQTNDGTFLYRDQFSHPSVEASRLASPRVAEALASVISSD